MVRKRAYYVLCIIVVCSSVAFLLHSDFRLNDTAPPRHHHVRWHPVHTGTGTSPTNPSRCHSVVSGKAMHHTLHTYMPVHTYIHASTSWRTHIDQWYLYTHSGVLSVWTRKSSSPNSWWAKKTMNDERLLVTVTGEIWVGRACEFVLQALTCVGSHRQAYKKKITLRFARLWLLFLPSRLPRHCFHVAR